MSPEDYVREVARKAGLSVAEEVARQYSEVVNRYEEAVKAQLRKGRKQEKNLREGEERRTRTVIVTPSYHQSVSRALAVQAILDRSVVELLGGMFLYSGGDDATAVLPPSKPIVDEESVGGGRGGEARVYPALMAAEAMRRLYWGLAPLSKPGEERVVGGLSTLALPASLKGFSAAWMPGGGSGDRWITVVVPSLAVYGRSTVVYYAGVKAPFWLVFSESHRVLDSKDNVVFMVGGRVSEKDMLAVVSASSGAALLPLSMPRSSSDDVATVIAAVEKLLRLVEAGTASSSLLQDARLYAMEAVIAASTEEAGAVRRLARLLASRNTRGDREASTVFSVLEEAAGAMGGWDAVGAACPATGLSEYLVDGFSAELETPEPLRKGNKCRDNTVVMSSSVFQVFNAARVTRSAK